MGSPLIFVLINSMSLMSFPVECHIFFLDFWISLLYRQVFPWSRNGLLLFPFIATFLSHLFDCTFSDYPFKTEQIFYPSNTLTFVLLHFSQWYLEYGFQILVYVWSFTYRAPLILSECYRFCFAYLLLTEQVYMSMIVEKTLLHNINSLNNDRYYTASLMFF